MLIDCVYQSNTFDEILELAAEAKNQQGRYDGFSPRQWFTGRNHPLLEAESVTPDSRFVNLANLQLYLGPFL